MGNITTPARGRLDGIEACRGVAATAVVLYHVAKHINKAFVDPSLLSVLRFGHAGVDLFFVISGFIILFVHYDDIGCPARLAHYGERRFTRVMPTYWVALALTVAMALGGGHAVPSGAQAALSALLLPSHTEPLLSVAWTLMYEVVFYGVFAVLIVNRMAGLALCGVWLGWIVLALRTDVGLGLPAFLHGTYNVEFGFGMAAALWLKTRAVPTPGWMFAAGIAAFATAAVAENAGLLDGYADAARLAYGIPAALIVLAVADLSRRGVIAIPAPLRWLGGASYSIYLFQFVCMGILWQLMLNTGLDRRLPHAVVFCVLALGAVTGGIVMSRLVEYPLTSLIRQRKAVPATVAA
jgi:exopolysaccharide production protein ExoZ